MTITQLEYIVAVDTHRNFAAAADSCFVTQPTLSMQIKKLEDELGIIIFDRTKKPVIPTEMGKKIISQARESLKSVHLIKDIIHQDKDVISGQLRIGIIPTLSPYLLPRFVVNFSKKYPQVELIVDEMMSEEILDRLKIDQIDVGIMVTPIKDDNVIEHPMFYEAFVVYMSTNHPLSKHDHLNLKDLDLNEMWLLKEGHCFRNQMINICAKEHLEHNKNHLRFESGSLETLKNIVEQQYGYTLLPELATFQMSEFERQFVHEFNDPKPIREVSVITHRSHLKKKVIEVLKNEITNSIPEDLLRKDRGKIVEWQ